MPRLLAVLSAAALAASCNSHPAPSTASTGGSAGTGSAAGSAVAAAAVGSGSQAAAAPAAAKPATALAQVQAGVPQGAEVAPAELTVPGLELFALTEPRPAGAAADDEVAPARLVGLAGGAGGKILEGRDLVRAAIEAKPDRKTLARIALWIARDDGDVLGAPADRAQNKARVRPPAIAGHALVFWVLTTDVPRQIERGKLDLATGALELALAPLPPGVAVGNAITTLDSVAVQRHVPAIKELAAACSDARARQTLLAALGNHPRARTRAAVADEAHRCGAAAVDPLVNAMQHDRSGLVRTQAAMALGRIGDARARPALAKIARGEDANLAWAANNALKKIK